MAKVVDRENPHRVLYEGDDPQGFVAKHEPRGHSREGMDYHQLQVVEDESAPDAESTEEE